MVRPTVAAVVFGLSLGLAVTLSVTPAIVRADELTDDELLQLFTMQRDAIKAAQGGTAPAPLTRGLGIGNQAGGQQGVQTRGVTLQQLDKVTATTMVATPDAGGDGSAVASAGDDVVTVNPTQTLQPLVPDAVATAGGTAAPLAGGAAPSVDAAAPATLGAPVAGDATIQTATADAHSGTTAQGTLAQPGTVVAVLPTEMMVNLQIRFGFDSAVLTDDQKPALGQMCRVMKVSDIKHFRIAGHTDAKGSDDYNLRLSQLRAEEVMRYLVRDCGVAADRLEALGMGKSLPLNAADPLAPENRRVEFQALS